MAEILIHIGDPDPGQPSSAYQHGDIVEISEDGEHANKPWLTVIKIPGVSAASLKPLLEEVRSAVEYDPIILRRKYKLVKPSIDILFQGKQSNQIEISSNDLNTKVLDNLHDKIKNKSVKGTQWRQSSFVQ